MSVKTWRGGMVAAMLALGSALAALAAGELALRAIGFSYPSFWVPDELTGSRLRPGVTGWQREEGEIFIEVNSRGLRDREHALQKPAGTYRIAVLGDSYTEALQVRLEETFWWRLAGELERCGLQPGRRIEAINFGVSGYGTAQQLLTLRHRAWQYAPDMVLLAFFPGNDVRNNSRALEASDKRPFFVLREGALVLDDAFRSDPTFVEARRAGEQRAFLQDLRTYQLLRRVRAGSFQLPHNAPIAVALARGEEPRPLTEPGVDDNVLREPVAPAWTEAWAVTEQLLLALRDETRQRGARLVVAVLSHAGAVHPDAALRARYARSLGVADLFYPETRLRRFGERHGIEIVALGPAMQRHAQATGAFLHGFPNSTLGFGHWNGAGHALGARLIAGQLCAAERLVRTDLHRPAPSSTRSAILPAR